MGPAETTLSQAVVRDAKGRFVAGTRYIPRRRPGGHVGNMNAAKNVWATYWRRRALRHEDRWVLSLVDGYVPSLIADKGGEVSFAQRKVAELAAVARVCWALAMVKGNLDAVARFVSVERQALMDLGLERQAKPALSLAEYLASKTLPVAPPPAGDAA